MIAPSIADIFYNNCFKNGILPITLPEPVVRRLLDIASDPATARMTVDLAAQTVEPIGGPRIIFKIDARRKDDLLNGVDEIGQSMRQSAQITAFETFQRAEHAWINNVDTVQLCTT